MLRRLPPDGGRFQSDVELFDIGQRRNHSRQRLQWCQRGQGFPGPEWTGSLSVRAASRAADDFVRRCWAGAPVRRQRACARKTGRPSEFSANRDLLKTLKDGPFFERKRAADELGRLPDEHRTDHQRTYGGGTNGWRSGVRRAAIQALESPVHAEHIRSLPKMAAALADVKQLNIALEAAASQEADNTTWKATRQSPERCPACDRGDLQPVHAHVEPARSAPVAGRRES